jgi:hypothetical protein
MSETNQGLSPKWDKAKNQCKKFRNEIRSYKIPKDKMIISYMFTQEDLSKLLNEAGSEPGGIRAYIGFEEVSGKLLPTLHVVGCVKKGDLYVDIVPSASVRAKATSNMGDPALEEGRPCPADCGTENLLNS